MADTIHLLPGESAVGGTGPADVVLAKGGILITNRRLLAVSRSRIGDRLVFSGWYLEDIKSIKKGRKSNTLILVATLISFGVLLFWPLQGFIGIVLGPILGFAFGRKGLFLKAGSEKTHVATLSLSPAEVTDLLMQIEERRRMRVAELNRESSGTGAASGVQKTEQRLLELDELRKKGLISEDEFYAKRNTILNRL